ncbi:MAG: hypothetical protein ACREOO_02270 [bacterium]
MLLLVKFQIFTAAFLFLIMAKGLYGQSVSTETKVLYPYNPNRPGAEAYFHGGAFVAQDGSPTAMLFNPAGLARLPERLTAVAESGWNSSTEFLGFFDSDFISRFRPLQFAALALQPSSKIALGAFYAQSLDYALDFGPIQVTTADHPEGTGEAYNLTKERRLEGLGLVLAYSFGQNLLTGAGVEWRRASIHEAFINTLATGHSSAPRFSAGAIFLWKGWQLGGAGQTGYRARNDLIVQTPERALTNTTPPDHGANRRLVLAADEKFPIVAEEPAAFRLGFSSPDFFNRIQFSADAEYKDFEMNAPIQRWQFYGGGAVQLSTWLEMGLGCFTFRKDYSAFVDGPSSEVFMTTGGTLKIAALRLTASYLDGGLFDDNATGQRFVNVALGYALP